MFDCKVVWIHQNSEGLVDLLDLEFKLKVCGNISLKKI